MRPLHLAELLASGLHPAALTEEEAARGRPSGLVLPAAREAGIRPAR